jgi:hypothetical protein
MSYTLAGCMHLLIALPSQRGGQNAMTTIDSGINQNQIQRSLVPMLRTWTHSIGWTVLLSTLLAVLFALAVDGCANIH